MKRKAIQFLVMLLVLVIPAISFAQVDPPPDPGNGGGPADAVPFDDTMNLIFLVGGLLFAAIVVVRQIRLGKIAGR